MRGAALRGGALCGAALCGVAARLFCRHCTAVLLTQHRLYFSRAPPTDILDLRRCLLKCAIDMLNVGDFLKGITAGTTGSIPDVNLPKCGHSDTVTLSNDSAVNVHADSSYSVWRTRDLCDVRAGALRRAPRPPHSFSTYAKQTQQRRNSESPSASAPGTRRRLHTEGHRCCRGCAQVIRA